VWEAADESTARWGNWLDVYDQGVGTHRYQLPRQNRGVGSGSACQNMPDVKVIMPTMYREEEPGTGNALGCGAHGVACLHPGHQPMNFGNVHSGWLARPILETAGVLKMPLSKRSRAKTYQRRNNSRDRSADRGCDA